MPRDPQSRWLQKLATTPVSDLLRGRITGSGAWTAILDKQDLVPATTAAIRSHVSRLPPWQRQSAMQRMLGWHREALAAGVAEERFAAALEDMPALQTILEAVGTESIGTVLNLPDPLRIALGEIARSQRRPARRRELIVDVLARMRRMLAEGVSAQAIAAGYGDAAVATALADDPQLSAISPLLPPQVVRLIHKVVRRTRLLPGERREVADELAAHFEDGLTAGTPPESLIAAFGPPRTAARLIRRARLRCRPWPWRVWRRMSQAVAALALTLAATWLVLLIRFHRGTPTIRKDMIAELDLAASGISIHDRAWPEYREALTVLGPRIRAAQLAGSHQKVVDALKDGPDSPDWPDARQYVIANQDVVAQALESSRRESLGFVHRDPDNQAWLVASGMMEWREFNPPGTPTVAILLPHVQSLWQIGLLFSGAYHKAVEDGESEEAVRMIEAQVALADHVGQGGFTVSRLVAHSLFRQAGEQASTTLLSKPDLFSDDQLALLDRLFAERPAASWSIDSMGDLRRFFADLVQRSYSDDGNGDGRFLAEGLRQLRFFETGFGNDFGLEYVPLDDDRSSSAWTDRAAYELVGPVDIQRVAGRREIVAKFESMAALLEEDLSQSPPVPVAKSPFAAELQRISESWTLRRRYLPLVVMFQSVPMTTQTGIRQHALTSQRTQLTWDASRTAVALERFRRRTGEYPESLTELTPGLLAAVPTEIATAEPLRYERVDDRPVLWSRGSDRDDDGGRTLEADERFRPEADGDWRLLPPPVNATRRR